MFDFLLKGGSVIDGSGMPRRTADVAIAEHRIAAIGDIDPAQAETVIDVQGLVVAPGFIDVHNHSDGWLLKDPSFSVKTLQGFTTEVLMSDGISYAPVTEKTFNEWFLYLRSLNGLEESDYRGWQSIADYMELLDRKTVQNTASQVPYANVRTAVSGFGSEKPTGPQMERIIAMIRDGLEQGATALSTGLEYLTESFAETDELTQACSPLSEFQALYVTHVRYPLGVVDGVREAVQIGRKSNAAVHISHLKGSNPEQAEQLLEYLNQTAVHQCDFSFDVYPYAAASTMLHYLLPYEVWIDGPSAVPEKLGSPAIQQGFAAELRKLDLSQVMLAWVPGQANKRWQGTYLSEFVEAAGIPAEQALSQLLLQENLAVLLVFHRGDDALVHEFLKHPSFMLGSDGIYFPDGLPHPRMFGSAARILGPCVREHRLFTLEEAVRKMTAYPAQRFGLAKRGQIREGWFADVCVFDAEHIQDTADYANPCSEAKGVVEVFVNGVQVVQNTQAVKSFPDEYPGRYIRREHVS